MYLTHPLNPRLLMALVRGLETHEVHGVPCFLS